MFTRLTFKLRTSATFFFLGGMDLFPTRELGSREERSTNQPSGPLVWVLSVLRPVTGCQHSLSFLGGSNESGRILSSRQMAAVLIKF